jgi:hypothetical protein
MKNNLVRLIGSLVIVASSGCVSSKYKLATAEQTPPPIALNLTNAGLPGTAAPALEATIHTVIVYHGPGSWKREAYWDEYVVTLVNKGTVPITINGATLTDFQGTPTMPGDNPWDLEKQSHAYEARVANAAGDVLKVGGATVLTSTAAGGVAVLGAMSASSELGAAMVVGGVVMAAAATVVIPVWSVVANVNSRHDIEAEYRRRRLGTPLWLMPGQVVQGSYFFRISPGPRQLVFQTKVGDDARDFAVDLARLAGLHLKTASVTASTP